MAEAAMTGVAHKSVCRVVPIEDSTRISELVRPHLPAEVFTLTELAYCGADPTLGRAAARLAGKKAILEMLGMDPEDPRLMKAVEIRAGRHSHGRLGPPCWLGHAPEVHLSGEPAERAALVDGAVELSLSHADRVGVAITACWPRGAAQEDSTTREERGSQ